MQMGDFPKQYYKVNGKMILEYTLDKFEESRQVDAIVIVMAPVWRAQLEADLSAKYRKLIGFAEPGAIRQESILSGIQFCMEDGALTHSPNMRRVFPSSRLRIQSIIVKTAKGSTNSWTGPSSLWGSRRRLSTCTSTTRRMRGRVTRFSQACAGPRRLRTRRA